MRYAGIGSRETPHDILRLMRAVAVAMAQEGWILRSGGAEGADTAFAEGARVAHGETEIFRPNQELPKWAFSSVKRFHPAPENLSDFAWRAHARNALILFGADGKAPVERVICWTPDAKVTGGTGQALRLAEARNILVLNLADKTVRSRVKARLRARAPEGAE